MKNNKIKKFNEMSEEKLDISDVISRCSNDDIIDFLFLYNILISNEYSYFWKRGKYGRITDFKTKKTYKIEQQVYERIISIINDL